MILLIRPNRTQKLGPNRGRHGRITGAVSVKSRMVGHLYERRVECCDRAIYIYLPYGRALMTTKRLKVGICLFVVGLIGPSLSLAEERYLGRSLSQWQERLASPSVAERVAAVEALAQFGRPA